MRQPIRVKVNGVQHESEVEPRLLLVQYLRENLNLTGTHIGCDTGQCGACTVLLDGQAVKSCMVLAVQADGAEARTVEGLAEAGAYHPVQQAFWDLHGLQCGFCTPGFLMASVGLLQRNPHPSDDEIREELSGNLCRCTGYQNIVAAVRSAAANMRATTAAPFEGESAYQPAVAPYAHGEPIEASVGAQTVVAAADEMQRE
ncbi:MAG TPA: (2Fe-2S)-binding protein, partial [Ktedonobacterales bacterium]|nr:(2Fe-2S)-binding protein [Ktedonobacterales bacterium]